MCWDGSVFPIVLLDESSQMIEPSSLVPLARFHCQRLIAVGDPKQLPPNLSDVEAPSATTSTTGPLSKALFERLSEAGVPTVLLRLQYRMHPTLMATPNRLFYDSALESGVGPEERPALLLPRAVDIDGRPLPPLSFVNVAQGQEQRERVWRGAAGGGGGESSCYNGEEIAAVVSVVSALLRKGVPSSSIGLITLYRSQWRRLREEMSKVMVQMEAEEEKQRRLQERFATTQGSVVVDDLHVLPDSDWKTTTGGVSGAGVQVNTVDSFQGGEKDIVILSTVKTSMSDFMDNARRINVALTRARHHLIIVGHQPTLLQSPLWKQVVTYVSCKLPGCFYASPQLMLSHVQRCRLNGMAIRVSEKEDSAQVRASQANAAGRKRGQRGEKAKQGSKKANESRQRQLKEEGGKGDNAAPRKRRRAVDAESDGEEEFQPSVTDEEESDLLSVSAALPPSPLSLPSTPASARRGSSETEAAEELPAEAKEAVQFDDEDAAIDVLQLLRDDQEEEKERKKREEGYESPRSGREEHVEEEVQEQPRAEESAEAAARRARCRIPELNEEDGEDGVTAMAVEEDAVDEFDF